MINNMYIEQAKNYLALMEDRAQAALICCEIAQAQAAIAQAAALERIASTLETIDALMRARVSEFPVVEDI